MSSKNTTTTTNASKPPIRPQPNGLGMRGAALAHSLNLLHQAGHTVHTVATGAGVTITIDGLALATDDKGRTQFVAAG